MLVLFCMRGCGCIERPAFPAPSIIEGHCLAKLGRIAPRECGGASGIQRHCERSEAIHLAAQRKNGLLRLGACHRARVRATRWLLAMTVSELAVLKSNQSDATIMSTIKTETGKSGQNRFKK